MLPLDTLLDQPLASLPLAPSTLDLHRRLSQLEARLKEAEDKVNELQQEGRNLKAENARLRQENDALTAENEVFKKAQSAATPKTGKGYLTWPEFEAVAVKKFGRVTGWKAVAAFELDIDIKVLNAWQTVGVIPAEYCDRVRAFAPEQIEPVPRKKWTDDEKAALVDLVAQGVSDRTIAKTLSMQFGRRFVETSVTGARRRFQISKVLRM
jgi:transposase-like protein